LGSSSPGIGGGAEGELEGELAIAASSDDIVAVVRGQGQSLVAESEVVAYVVAYVVALLVIRELLESGIAVVGTIVGREVRYRYH
jgi:hypothetical protein